MALVKSNIEFEYTNSGSTTIEAGTPVQVGTYIFGVTASRIEPSETGVLYGTGIYTLTCGNSTVASAGALAYWDASNSKVVASGTSLLAIGVFTEAVTSGSTECTVAIFPTATVSASS